MHARSARACLRLFARGPACTHTHTQWGWRGPLPPSPWGAARFSAAPDEPQDVKAVPHPPSPAQVYLSKFKGDGSPPPPATPVHKIAASGLASLFGFAALSVPVHLLDSIDSIFIIAPFGASAALLFGAHDGPLSQPRNVVGGHVVSGLVGVTANILTVLLDVGIWFSAPVAVAGAIVAMQASRTFHPPAAATSLLAVVGSPALLDLGYQYVFVPCLCGSVSLVIIASLVNNLIPGRHYPKYWL